MDISTNSSRGKGGPGIAAIAAMVFFAIAGLISGVTAGAFSRQTPMAQTTTSPKQNMTIPMQKSTVTPTATAVSTLPELQKLLDPKVLKIPDTLTAGTNNEVQIQAISGDGMPATRNDITCRLWLVKKAPTTDAEKATLENALRDVNNLNNPLPGEEANALQFDPQTAQVQRTDNQGMCDWKIQANQTLTANKYYFMYTTDWQGIRYRWSFFGFFIQK